MPLIHWDWLKREVKVGLWKLKCRLKHIFLMIFSSSYHTRIVQSQYYLDRRKRKRKYNKRNGS
jgi:hypothetical protein